MGPSLQDSLRLPFLPGWATPSLTSAPPAQTGAGDWPVLLLLAALLVLALLGVGAVWLLRRAGERPARHEEAPELPPLPVDTVPFAPMTRASAGPPIFLRTVGDPARTFPIGRLPFAIGRAAGNDLVIDENFAEWQTVSREHAIISRHPRGYVIEDRGSRNGVRVDGRPTSRNLLRDGAEVAIGGVVFLFFEESRTA